MARTVNPRRKPAARSRSASAASRTASPPVSQSASETRSETPQLYPTKNDLPEAARVEAIRLLNQRLADAIDLQTQCKQAHWNVKGPTFIALHKLFDDINEDVEEYVDLIAERVVQLGGIAEATVGVVAERSTLVDYPLALSTGAEHVAALSDALAAFGRTVRLGIEEMNELEDAASADILTEVSRGVDKWLWFVEAHQQGA
ncbi:MAG TPA: DNA starvation/stationary phase protection protein Dps [Gemmatimonadales bacterium]|jgi:starvation-inducible DNA-binding protein|nr:DNA starvation/stationary phase protection protein Dps [Gemmatimonadales bacterium]